MAWLTRAVEPLKFTSTQDQMDVMATVNGGGIGGQSGAVRMGLSRALSVFNPELRPGLRKNGFLTRDSRMRERKSTDKRVLASASSSASASFSRQTLCPNLRRLFLHRGRPGPGKGSLGKKGPPRSPVRGA